MNTKKLLESTLRLKNANWTWIGLGCLAILLGLILLVFPESSRNLKASLLGAGRQPKFSAFPVVVPTIKYGFALDTFQVFEGTIQQNDNLSKLLLQRHVSYADIEKLAANGKAVFDVRNFKADEPYLILAKDSAQCADYLFYEPNVYGYYIFHLKDSLWIERINRPVVTKINAVKVKIESSLWESMEKNGADPEVIKNMEEALKYSIDFHHVQAGDEFKLVYDQNFIAGKSVDPGKVHAAYYKTEKKAYYAYYYESKQSKGYFDQDGRPMKKGLLKSPVKYSHISSGYNLARLHPILNTVRPHFGTDYAAPYGAPIMTVGDGVVEEAGYKSGNGNYVKIRHNHNIQTQYLHMSRFAGGMRRGTRVAQGQTIGFVGSTGLATGPHVCFRFWMNGKQVNHLRFSYPPPDPLPASEMPDFNKVKKSLEAYFAELDVKKTEPTILKKEGSGHP